jgi:hypothetical protein
VYERAYKDRWTSTPGGTDVITGASTAPRTVIVHDCVADPP